MAKWYDIMNASIPPFTICNATTIWTRASPALARVHEVGVDLTHNPTKETRVEWLGNRISLVIRLLHRLQSNNLLVWWQQNRFVNACLLNLWSCIRNVTKYVKYYIGGVARTIPQQLRTIYCCSDHLLMNKTCNYMQINDSSTCAARTWLHG